MAKINMKSAVAGKKSAPAPTEKKAQKFLARVSQYNGKPVFQIIREVDEDDPEAFPAFACGLGKATKIVAFFDEIKAFVASGGTSVD